MAVLNELLAEEIKAKLTLQKIEQRAEQEESRHQEFDEKEELLPEIVALGQEMQPKKKVSKVVVLDHYPEEDEKIPAKYFIQNALGEYVFFRYRSRTDAQHNCDEMFGKGKYTVKVVVKAIVR